MSQAADVRPEPTFQRKAAIVTGGATDHAGRVSVVPIPDFDLDRTIFQTLEGAAARYVMKKRVGKEVVWETKAASEVQSAYDEAQGAVTLPDIAPELLEFMVNECNFDVEHADGSFLDHLYFCFEYGVHHYSQHSPLVLLLHSILGTGTNTFCACGPRMVGLRSNNAFIRATLHWWPHGTEMVSFKSGGNRMNSRWSKFSVRRNFSGKPIWYPGSSGCNWRPTTVNLKPGSFSVPPCPAQLPRLKSWKSTGRRTLCSILANPKPSATTGNSFSLKPPGDFIVYKIVRPPNLEEQGGLNRLGSPSDQYGPAGFFDDGRLSPEGNPRLS